MGNMISVGTNDDVDNRADGGRSGPIHNNYFNQMDDISAKLMDYASNYV